MKDTIKFNGDTYVKTEGSGPMEPPTCDLCEYRKAIPEKVSCSIYLQGDCDLGFYYKKINKETTMSKSELNFKCAVVTRDRAQELGAALEKAGIPIANKSNWESCLFMEVCNGELTYWTRNNSAAVLGSDLEVNKTPELTLEDAIKLLNQVDLTAPEFDIKPFDKIIIRPNGSFDFKWAPAVFSHIDDDCAFAIGEEDHIELFARYEGNERYVGASGSLLDENAYPEGWWEMRDGKPIWRRR